MGKIVIPDRSEFPVTADLVIIGGGIIGCATAFYASQAGLDVLVVEKRESLAALTTPASAEAVRAQFDDPDNVAMMKASLETYERFADEIGLSGYEINFHQQGYLFMTSREDGPEMLRERVHRQKKWGLNDVEFLDGEEVCRRFSYVAPIVTAATFRQRDGWLSTHEATYGFAKGSTARFFLQTEGTGFLLDGQGVAGLETTRGPIHTRQVVIAAGPYSGRIAHWAGVDLPVVVLRRQKAVIHSSLVPEEAPMTIDLDTGAYWRPELKGGLLGWAEAVKEEPAEPMDHVPADWDFPAIALEGCARLSPFWEKVAETLTGEEVYSTAGQYTISPDHKPIIGPVAQVPGLYVSVGYSGHGIMAAPDAGRRLAAMLTGRLSPEENPFSLERLSGKETLLGEQLVI